MKQYLKYPVIFLWLWSCQNAEERHFDHIEDILGFSVPKNFKSTEKTSDSSVGDYTETFIVEYHDYEFSQIIGKLDLEQFQESEDQNFYYFNTKNAGGDKISLIIDLRKKRIKYTLADI